MPGNCPASLRPTAACLWKTFRSKPNAIPVEGQKLFAFPPESRSPSDRNAVRIHNGMMFGFRTESRSPSTGFPTFMVGSFLAWNEQFERAILAGILKSSLNTRSQRSTLLLLFL